MGALINPSQFGASGAAYRSQLAFEGTNGSTTFTDTGTGPPIWTAFGNAQIDTSQHAVGLASGKFDGTNSYITTPDAAGLRFGTSDFELRFRYRFNSMTGYQTIGSKGYAVTGGWLLQTGNGDGKLTFYRDSGTTVVAADAGSALSAGVWYAMRFYRVGNNFFIERDGVSVGTGSLSGVDFNATTQLAIGGGSNTGFNNYWFNGWMDQFEMV